MTPGARVAAAIEILDDISEGLAAEQALTRWARRSRFAGSKDRAAIRDYVFDIMRCRRSAAHYGQDETGRALMIGLLTMQGADIDGLFNAEGHAPAPLEQYEKPFDQQPSDEGTLWNLPDWLVPLFKASLGTKADATAHALQSRAPVCLRVNLAKTTVEAAQSMLGEEGVQTTSNPSAKTALTVTEGARKIRNSKAYLEGFVELQDAASQAVVEVLPPAARVLDFCAGGGGKALAIAALSSGDVFAHDIDPRRMSDLPARATRSGATVGLFETAELTANGPFDVVLCDAPCSGSGAWRRAAEGKWTLTAERLNDLNGIQDKILVEAARLVAPKGTLAYATCSILTVENEDRVSAFLANNPDWQLTYSARFDVNSGADGFYTAHLTRA